MDIEGIGWGVGVGLSVDVVGASFVSFTVEGSFLVVGGFFSVVHCWLLALGGFIALDVGFGGGLLAIGADLLVDGIEVVDTVGGVGLVVEAKIVVDVGGVGGLGLGTVVDEVDGVGGSLTKA